MRVAFSIGRITWEKTTISELIFWIDGSIHNLVWFFIPECPSILADGFVFFPSLNGGLDGNKMTKLY